MVRSLGTQARNARRCHHGERHQGYARPQHLLQPLHDSRRYDFRLVGWRQQSGLLGHVQLLRLRRTHQRSWLAHAEILPAARPVATIPARRTDPARASRSLPCHQGTGHHRMGGSHLVRQPARTQADRKCEANGTVQPRLGKHPLPHNAEGRHFGYTPSGRNARLGTSLCRRPTVGTP